MKKICVRYAFRNIGKTADAYYGNGCAYKDCGDIRLQDFMGIRTRIMF